MPVRYRVALHGFSEFERKALTFCFKHAASREPAYVQVDLIADSDFIVADASHEAIAGSVTRGERMADTLFVGDKPPRGASARLGRPIDPERILRALDEMAARRGERPAATRPDVLLPLDTPESHIPLLDTSDIVDTTPAAFQHEPVSILFADLEPFGPASAPASPQPVADRAGARPPRAGAASFARGSTQHSAPAVMAPGPATPGSTTPPSPAAPAKPARRLPLPEAERVEAKAAARRASRRARLAQTASPAADAPRDVLLLDPAAEPVALGLLLEAFGFVVHRAHNITEAVAVLERTPLAAAFLDIASDDASGIDGLDLCQQIKQRVLPLSGAVPAVMLMTGRDSAAGRVRAKLAGCDAFLIRPVRRGDAARALESCNVALPADARGS